MNQEEALVPFPPRDKMCYLCFSQRKTHLGAKLERRHQQQSSLLSAEAEAAYGCPELLPVATTRLPVESELALVRRCLKPSIKNQMTFHVTLLESSSSQ